MCTKDPTCKGFYQIYEFEKYQDDHVKDHVKCESGYEKRELLKMSNSHILHVKGTTKQFDAKKIRYWEVFLLTPTIWF